MEDPTGAFWLQDPVPLTRLADLAMARRAEATAVLANLAASRLAIVWGPRGVGRSTFAHQLAQAWAEPERRRTVILAGPGLLQDGEADHVAALGVELAPARTDPSWAGLGLDATDLLILDGVAERHLAWARRLPSQVAACVVLIVDAPTPPADAILLAPFAETACRDFLEHRARSANCTWTNAALQQAVALSDGLPSLLQELGSGCVQAALAHRRRMDLDAVVSGASHVALRLPLWLQEPLRSLDGPRLALAKAMVRFPAESPTQWALRCGLEPKAAIVHLQRLVQQGLVRKERRGRYVFAQALLGLHLQVRHGRLVHVLKPTGATPASRRALPGLRR